MITLIGDRVAVSPIYDPDRSPGGIWIPDQAKDRCDQGLVKYVGPQVKDLHIGDYVVFSGYVGTLLYVEGEGRLIVLPEEFCQATLVDPPSTPISGLYFKDQEGDYFEATYEKAMEIIADSFKDFSRALSIETKKPASHEYDKLRAGAGGKR